MLFLPALLLGAVFPLTLELAPASDRPARLVGRLYAVNAVGCVAGAVLGTFVLVALLGTRGALLLLAWLPAADRALGPARGDPVEDGAHGDRGLFVAALAGGSLLAAPRGFYQDLFEKRFGRVVWFAEGVTETVAVCEHKDGSRWIQFSDGRGASGTWSFQGGWLYAHLPLLLHPRPRSAAVICFGTGNTLGAASVHPLEALDGIELSPEVVKAAPLFAATNHDVATSGRARIVIEDGRSYMLATDRRYDVITEEPPLVHTAGVVNLYSRDFYELCSRRLTDDGIMAVWLATWELETVEMRMLVRAFVDAFPHASLWDCTHPGEWLLIGSKKPLRIDLDALAARMADPDDRPRPRADRRRHGRDPLAGRPPLPPPDGARGARRLRRRRAAGHRRPERRRLHDAAARPRQLRPGGVGHRRALGLRGGGARPAERAPPARVRPGLHVPRAGRAPDRELRRP